jgi:hypothetical protein
VEHVAADYAGQQHDDLGQDQDRGGDLDQEAQERVEARQPARPIRRRPCCCMAVSMAHVHVDRPAHASS